MNERDSKGYCFLSFISKCDWVEKDWGSQNSTCHRLVISHWDKIYPSRSLQWPIPRISWFRLMQFALWYHTRTKIFLPFKVIGIIYFLHNMVSTHAIFSWCTQKCFCFLLFALVLIHQKLIYHNSPTLIWILHNLIFFPWKKWVQVGE